MKIAIVVSAVLLGISSVAYGQNAQRTIPLVGSPLEPINSGNPVPISGSITASLAGFTPSGSYASPLSVSNSSANVALPTGTVVAVYNVGSTAAYCKLGTTNAVTATTSDDYVPSNSAVGYTVGSNTYIACITASSTTTINVSGGSGLLTGFGGGGSGGGGGGGAVYGPTAAGSAAANPPVLLGGTIDGTATGNVDNLKVSGGLAFVNAAQPTAANLNATVVGTGTFAVQATLQASATTAIGKVDPNTIATWGLFATTQNVTAPTNAWLGGCQFTTAPTTITSTNVSPVQCDNANNMLVNVKTSVLPTGAASSANQTNATQKTQVVDGSGNVIASTSNALNVQCANCSGSGVSTADAATFTAGTSLFAGTGGQFTSGGATACVTGHQCEAAITADRSLFVNLADLAGTALGAPSNYGTSPGAVAVQGVNAFITNAPNVTNTGTFAVQATLQASATTAIGKVDPNTIGNWGLAASTQNGTTPTNGALVMGQFNTSPTTITSGNVSPLQMDSAGNLLVNIKAGAGSGGTALADGATFTIGTTSETPAACTYVSGGITVTSGKSSVLSCTAAASLHTTVDNTNANGSATSANSSPVVIASDQAAVAVKLNTTPSVANGNGVVVSAATTGGASTTGNIAANNTTAVVVKSSAGTLYGVQVYGIGSAPAYLKIYNATSATCGSGTPVKRLMIPAAATAANGAGSNISFGPQGIAFGTGITYCVTTGITDADTTAPAASTFLVNIDWE